MKHDSSRFSAREHNSKASARDMILIFSHISRSTRVSTPRNVHVKTRTRVFHVSQRVELPRLPAAFKGAAPCARARAALNVRRAEPRAYIKAAPASLQPAAVFIYRLGGVRASPRSYVARF